ncbi:hypothetical protein Rru_A0195 [Rhodospirillum rubrum ATCC 11170]|uniref:Uncharacterized protein n=2 Tax=Rhodospirillum rubrum TaxID=1085 RepID=Q2RXZ5_RHORT|nr:hypothetical protein [Rhodospirillum rubrum]ABC21000.1 hypothetical protein Rru_A0195 [Rhodospirillum rubrum ATCC 11170]MBK5952545.1 hypothetical protein [Rhodospirillum rubrum]QXG80696.1 hypothetical protein KUL73_01040 [Rhodospirillum rubrum]HAP99312.1 hypothetical protein [Rhodospirillum rubrum]HCF16766.1 hypothetical protein [Rhodospirillum rubrum]
MGQYSWASAAANLVFGYRPVWTPQDTAAPYPYFEPPVAALSSVTPNVTPHDVDYWAPYPTITLHDSASSLLSGLNAYRVTGLQKGVVVQPGPLMLSDADGAKALKQAGDWIGLDLAKARSYMLVTTRRANATLRHPYFAEPGEADRDHYLTAEALALIAALKPIDAAQFVAPFSHAAISQGDAASYLAAITALGSHVVASEVFGDVLFQVFAFDAEHFRVIEAAFQRQATLQADGHLAVTGAPAASWAYWTTPVTDNGFGYVSEYGALRLQSRDPALDAALTEGKWASPYVPKDIASIFAYATDYRLIEDFESVVPSALVLAPLAALISNPYVAGPWDRIVKGALLQKWGDAVRIPQPSPVDIDWSTFFPDANASWASGIVTPTIDVYQELVDISRVSFLGADVVGANFQMNSFTCFSQVLEANVPAGSGPVMLPSDRVVLVAGTIDASRSIETPVLTMSEAALLGLTVVCDTMFGAVLFAATTRSGAVIRKAALDGLLFETTSVQPATGRAGVAIAGALANTPSPELVLKLKGSIGMSVTAAESLLHARSDDAERIRGIEQAYLRWLASIIPADTEDLDLAYSRSHALYIAENVATFGTDIVFVPYVTYETYRPYVSSMITQAQTLSQTIIANEIMIRDTINSYKVMTSLADLNDNVKRIGGVLTGYFKALADGQKAMNGYYDQVLDQLGQQQAETLKEIATLGAKLDAQRVVISNTGDPPGIVQTFQDDYADYARDQVAACVVSVVEGLFTAGLSMAAIPSEAAGGVLKALKALKDTYDKIKAIVATLEKLQSALKTMNKVASLNDLSKTIAAAGKLNELQMPTQLEFQTLAENVRAALTNVPDSGRLNQDKANLIAAVNTLSNIGSALVQTQSRSVALAMEIVNQNRLKTINGQQQASMSALSDKLNLNSVSRPPDINSIDLIGTTGPLQFQLKQVLSVLANTLELQDGAVQYEYFGDPAIITSFSLQNLLAVVSQQDLNAIHGIGNLNPPPQDVADPITFRITDVPASRLTGGNTFRFQIDLAAVPFLTYDMVRVRRVVPRIVQGIRSSASGRYELAFSTSANPFMDRAYNRKARLFATDLRKFGPYVYDISSGALISGGSEGPFDNRVTQVTPFAEWDIALPADRASNKDLETRVLLDIEVDFYITAHYDDPIRRQRVVRAANRKLLAANALTANALAAAGDSGPTLASLQTQMYQNQEVLQGWDAAFTTLVGPVNAFLYWQFNQMTGGTNQMAVASYYCDNVIPFGKLALTTVTQLAFSLSNPLVQFIPGNDSVTVIQTIISGTIKTGSMQVDKKTFVPAQCSLPADPVTFTANPSDSTLTLSVSPVFAEGMVVTLGSTGTLPAPLQGGDQTYWLVALKTVGKVTTVQVSETAGGKPIVLTNTGAGTHTISPAIDWNDPYEIDVSKNPYVRGSVPLAQVEGVVTPPDGQGSKDDTRTVLLDFPSGSFTFQQFSVNPPDWDPEKHGTQISNALANYFAFHEIKYVVQTINLKNLNADTHLTPSLFKLHAGTTRAGNNILQMQIVTTSKKPQSTGLVQVDEPVPYNPANPVPGGSDFTASLILSSKLTFEHVFVANFNQGSANLQAKAVAPAQGYQTYTAKIASGTVAANVDFKSEYDVHGTRVKYRISASGNTINWDLAGLEFKPSEHGGYDLYYSNGDATKPEGGTTVAFQYSQWIPPYSYDMVYVPGYWTDWDDNSAIAYVTMTGSYPLKTTGQGLAQVVEFANTNPSVTFSKASNLTPQGPCDCNDNDLKIALLNALGAAVPAKLKASIEKVQFKSISVLALESLLFPADQLVNMRDASVPGDLLVVGSFYNKVRKTAAAYDVTLSASSGAKGVFGTTAFQNGQGNGSATISGLPKAFSFQYGPIEPALGGMVTYTVDIEAGTINPGTLLLVVVQPDVDKAPKQVVLLPPGFGVGT